MEWLAVILALAVGYLISSKSALTQLNAITQQPVTQQPAVITSSTITTGGRSGGVFTASTDLNIANQAVGSLGSVGAGSPSGLFGSGFASEGTKAAAAIPIIGAVVSVAAGIVGAISAHHQQALQAEGKALNDADPRAVQALALVVQGTANGEIPTTIQAKQYCDQIVNDWYGEVKNIQRGMWPYTLTPSQDPSVISGDPTPGIMNWFDYNDPNDRRPDPCNAACVVGHYFIERDRAIAMIHVNRILSGQHGVCIFPALPPHETQQGYPQVSITY